MTNPHVEHYSGLEDVQRGRQCRCDTSRYAPAYCSLVRRQLFAASELGTLNLEELVQWKLDGCKRNLFECVESMIVNERAKPMTKLRTSRMTVIPNPR